VQKNICNSEKNKKIIFFIFFVMHLSETTTHLQVEYADWKEFLHLVYVTQSKFLQLISTAVQEERQNTLNDFSQYWFQIDTSSFHHLQNEAHAVLQIMTKNTCQEFCKNMAEVLCRICISAAITCANTMKSLNNLYDLNVHPSTDHFWEMIKESMHDGFCMSFAGPQPIMINSLHNSGVISSILFTNFEIFDTVMMEYFSTSQCEHLMLAICMGLHPRLGKMSTIFALETEILHLICSYLFVNNQKKYALCNMHAQWIC